MNENVHVVCPHCDGVNRVPRGRLGAGPRCGRCHASLFTARPVALDEARFATHVQRSDLPLIVDFWAPWCGPCRMMAPIFEEAARRIEPAARLIKVDTDEAQGLAAKYGIRSIPTLAVFRGGHEAARTAGAMDLTALLAWLRPNL
ncbi:thioredoxin TrxC [Thioalkalicoccus limnaeus]|uniref:Thioredoxin n=1 Tax=Thioalkalicoccus limnaeus TaxID=120681 RepID=A0ABV4BBH3_9GAMM